MRRARVIVLGTAVLMHSYSASAEATGATVGLAFCAAVRASDEAAAEELMTAELQSAVAELRASDAAFRNASPTEKPPLGDGLRLTAFPDYPESCTVSEATSESVVLTYAPAGAPDAIWRDQLLLVPVDGALRIADILYAPDGTYRFSSWLADSSNWK
jgi:hypothetical protein